MKGGARACARVKFCEGARTCVRTRWYYPYASRGLPTQNECRLIPSSYDTSRSTKKAHIDFCCVMQECCRKFPSIFFPVNSWWSFFYCGGEKRFLFTSQALFLLDLEGVIHSQFTLQPPQQKINDIQLNGLSLEARRMEENPGKNQTRKLARRERVDSSVPLVASVRHAAGYALAGL